MNTKYTLFALVFSFFHYAIASTYATALHDYVIVGAGTAGCALAARLCTFLPSAKIALLERAPPRDPSAEFLVRSPRQMWNSWTSTKVSEIYNSLPDPGTGNRTTGIITGNTLGGSSAINGMQWVVPARGTVDKWGIKGLTTETSQKYFQRAFRTVGFAAQGKNLRHKYAREYIKAAEAAGFPENLDPFDNSVRRDMFENLLAVDSKGRRIDSCTAYLTPVQDGECARNLKLIQGVTVTKILLKGKKRPRAVGVEYVMTNDKQMRQRKTIRARKEVLISAGPFESPKLLQLSGIGPANVLRKAGIPLKVSLPVGAKTQARPFVSVASMYSGVPLEPSNNSTLLNSPASRQQWESGRGGVLGTGSFMANGRDRLDAYVTGTGNFFPEFVDLPIISSNCNGNVKSFGFIRVTNSDPFSSPEVQLALLSNKEDVDRLERCLNRLVKVHDNFPKNFNMKWLDPSNGVVNRTWIRNTAGWAGHYVGGCAVGTVLTSDLRVRKMRGLRVIDSSSLKTNPASSGPMASTYMLAEYMAELIARPYRRK